MRQDETGHIQAMPDGKIEEKLKKLSTRVLNYGLLKESLKIM